MKPVELYYSFEVSKTQNDFILAKNYHQVKKNVLYFSF